MESKYLLDTSTCVFIMRGKYHLEKKLKEIGVDKCVISEITVAELLYGAYWSGNEENIKLTNSFIDSIEVIPIYASLTEFAKQKTYLRKQGISIDDFDLLIACSGIYYNYIVVTDNTKHFDRLPVKVENWVKR